MSKKQFLFLGIVSVTAYLRSVVHYNFDENVINEIKTGIEVMTQYENEVGARNGALVVYKKFLQDLQTHQPSELFTSDHYQEVRKVVEYIYDIIEDDGVYRNALMLALTNNYPHKIKDTWNRVIKTGIDILTYQIARRGIKVVGETNHLQFLKNNQHLDPDQQGKYIIAACIIRCIFFQLRNEKIKHINEALIQEKRIQ